MKRIKEILIVLIFALLTSYSTSALAFYCVMDPNETPKECAKICGGAGVMGIFGFLSCL
ncbi:hypothetical protein ILU99_004414 [Salmonella enterica]|nr:hypothetical protein [Salmonella enterica subsp. enterica serovar Bonariensis]EDQ5137236.1 hypothetical protein [Salmonella enterica]EDV1006673.1 hypothetical protein [Salmonella enterica subsp. enterica]EDX6896889.1 hypothetical protein [Salmonella enterica subsp. enterica serovar Nottingham]EDX8938329.1 hypothetical protein [Salmonella enterica subsp. enterica serovar Aba]EEO4319664.1 hypothetical protein [Salmonella enterica subsp. enterica serovar Praha]EHF1445756.1 hypothetical protei